LAIRSLPMPMGDPCSRRFYQRQLKGLMASGSTGTLHFCL